jgi:hypothetical protein
VNSLPWTSKEMSLEDETSFTEPIYKFQYLWELRTEVSFSPWTSRETYLMMTLLYIQSRLSDLLALEPRTAVSSPP